MGVLWLLLAPPARATGETLCDTIHVEEDLSSLMTFDFEAILRRHGLGEVAHSDTVPCHMDGRVKKSQVRDFRESYSEIVTALKDVVDERDRWYLQAYCLILGTESGMEVSDSDLLSSDSLLRSEQGRPVQVQRLEFLFGKRVLSKEDGGLLFGIDLGGELVTGKPREYYRGGGLVGLDLGLASGSFRAWGRIAHKGGTVSNVESERYWPQVDSVLPIPDYNVARIWSASIAWGYVALRYRRLSLVPFITYDWAWGDFGALQHEYSRSKSLPGVGLDTELSLGRVQISERKSILLGFWKWQETTRTSYSLGLRLKVARFDYDSNKLHSGLGFSLSLVLNGIIKGNTTKSPLLRISD